MDTRSSAIGIVAPLLLVMVFSSAGFPNPVHTYGRDFNLPIPARLGDTKGWMTDAAIEVTDHLVIEDLDIRIDVSHTSVFDLQLFLQSPAGTVICLNVYDPYHEFFIGANYTNTVFDDEAPLFIKDGVAPFTGRFRPVEPYRLSEFDGQDAFGSWCLRIYDVFYSDTGSFNHLELTITAPEPASAILMTIGVCLIRLRKPRGS